MNKYFVIFLVLAAFVAVLSAQSCKSKMECGRLVCTDLYHAECVKGACTCPPKACTTDKDCPHSSGSGCPPFAKAECRNKFCFCDRS